MSESRVESRGPLSGISQLADGAHDPLGDAIVVVLASGGLEFFGRQADGLADGDADAGETDFSRTSGKCVAGTGDSNRLDDRAGFHGDETDAGRGFSQFAIEGAFAFGEDADAFALLELADDGFQAGPCPGGPDRPGWRSISDRAICRSPQTTSCGRGKPSRFCRGCRSAADRESFRGWTRRARVLR